VSKRRDERLTTYDATNLRRLRGVNAGAGADLNQGFGTFRDRDRREIYPAPVHVIFGAIEASGQTKVLEDVDVITWRGNMSKLLTTAWNVSEAWTMEAELVNNRTIVLNVKETEEGLRKALTRDGRDERMCYWGYAFEEAACSEKPFEEPVDCMECFCCVVKTKLGDLNVLMAGEVDCFEGDAELANYVELKTSRVMNDERQVKRFEKEKLLKWWAQSFALGVRRIMVGFRDDHGRVVKTQMLETLKLPGYVVKHANSWTPKDALRCASAVLTKLKELLADEPSGTRVRVEYEPKKAKHRVNFIRDDSIPDFLPADARAKLMNDGSWRERGPQPTATPTSASEPPRDVPAPELSETASAMSIRARTEGRTNRIEYIRSLGPAALLYMQGKDPRRTLRGRVDDDTMGGIGIDPSIWIRQKANYALQIDAQTSPPMHIDHKAAPASSTKSSGARRASSSGVGDAHDRASTENSDRENSQN